MFIRNFKKWLYKIGIPKRLSHRRLQKIDSLFGGRLLTSGRKKKTILEIGCQMGKDLVSFLRDREDLHIIGLDMKDWGLRQDNFNMVIGNATHLPFKQDAFDISASIGVYQLISPLESLGHAVTEINRVSRSFIVVVPSISTIIEPTKNGFFWQLRDKNKKTANPGWRPLIHMSDEAWLAFKGFENCHSERYCHVPPFVSNLLIYKDKSTE